MADSLKIVGARGGAELRVLRSGVVYGKFQGIIEADAARPLLDFYDALMSADPTPIVSILDATDVQTVDSDFRDRVSLWSRERRSKNETHVLIRSKMVEMAISLINLLSSRAGLHAYSDRARWEAVAARLGVAIPERSAAARR